MKKIIAITSIALSLAFVFAIIVVCNTHTIDLEAAPPQFPGYEVHTHVGKGKYHIVTLGINFDSKSIDFDRPEDLSTGRASELSVTDYYLKNGAKDGAANANVWRYFLAHPECFPGFIKSRESTVLRGRAATQARFFYFWGTIYKKIPQSEDSTPGYAVAYAYWDDDDGIFRSGLQEIGPSIRRGGRGGYTTNMFDKNDYPVLLR